MTQTRVHSPGGDDRARGREDVGERGRLVKQLDLILKTKKFQLKYLFLKLLLRKMPFKIHKVLKTRQLGLFFMVFCTALAIKIRLISKKK